MRSAIVLLLLTGTLLPFSSCKKGCTNPRAQNYNASAKEDDASCLFCDTVEVSSGFETDYITDYTSGSPYYGYNVLTATTDARIVNQSGNACPMNSLNAVCNGFSFVLGVEYADIVLNNMVSDTILVSGTIRITNQQNFTQFDTVVYGFKIPPYQSKTVCREKFLGCMQSSFISTGIDMYSVNFQYR